MLSPDRFIVEFDKALRSVFAAARSRRPAPDAGLPEGDLSAAERQHATALMRIDHCGEICAQALYQGQSLTSGDPTIRAALQQAADEETEHLAWTEQRITALGGRKSLLNPLWYGGALALGCVAGWCGERWNLGFLAETERQVEAHLDGHITQLPARDEKSRKVLAQMRDDEVRHAQTAERLGGAELPTAVKCLMKVSARLMTGTAYYL
jgi:3-demethoxyubiquinol 3-hydroxylase